MSENGSAIIGKNPKLISLIGSAEIRNCHSEYNGAAVSIWGGKITVSDNCIISGNISEETAVLSPLPMTDRNEIIKRLKIN